MPRFKVDKFKRGDRCWVFMDGFGSMASIVLSKVGKAKEDHSHYMYEVMCSCDGEKFITEIDDGWMCSITRDKKMSDKHDREVDNWLECWDDED